MASHFMKIDIEYKWLFKKVQKFCMIDWRWSSNGSLKISIHLSAFHSKWIDTSYSVKMSSLIKVQQNWLKGLWTPPYKNARWICSFKIKSNTNIPVHLQTLWKLANLLNHTNFPGGLVWKSKDLRFSLLHPPRQNPRQINLYLSWIIHCPT